MTKSIFLTAALLTSLTAEEVLYFSMDDTGSPLTDSIGALKPALSTMDTFTSEVVPFL